MFKKIIFIMLALVAIAFMDTHPTNAATIDEAVHIPITVTTAPSAQNHVTVTIEDPALSDK